MTNGSDPAFPYPEFSVDRKPCLTKREYFAAMAMQGIVTHERFHVRIYGDSPENMRLSVEMAKAAIGMADALIAELSKEDRL